jgi:hypothetical protein
MVTVYDRGGIAAATFPVFATSVTSQGHCPFLFPGFQVKGKQLIFFLNSRR